MASASHKGSYAEQAQSSSTDDTPLAQHGTPLRVLVQTKTHLIPGDQSADFGQRFRVMQNLICQHIWRRDFDRTRERIWSKGEFALDDHDCWFLVDYHGAGRDPAEDRDPPDPDPPMLWYNWTGTELLAVRDPLPHKVRREIQHYPFRRSRLRYQKYVPGPRPPGQFRSQADEMRIQREILRNTLVSGLALTHELLRFARDHPDEAAWVRARVSPEAWARLDDHSEDPGEAVGHYVWVADPPEEDDAALGDG
ncbi:hypothetical protein VTG60DRAFT_3385 [Thermothelomyces hinnuleus]